MLDTIGQRIKYLREKHHLTQTELASIIGVSTQAVSSWEKDIKSPRMVPIEKMAKFFNIRKTDIIDGFAPTHSDKTSIPAIIKERRTELNLTLKDVADYVGVNVSTVSRWEAGHINNMMRDKIIKLSDILQVNPVLLMEEPSYVEPEQQQRTAELDKKLSALIDNLCASGKKFTVDGVELAPHELIAVRSMLQGALMAAHELVENRKK